MRLALTLALLGSAGIAGADEVWLKGGGRLVGDVLSRDGGVVVLAVGPGTVKLPLARVERIVSSAAAITEYRGRAEKLAPNDVQGWSALAEWAEQNDLRTQSREAWRRVLAADPENTVAHLAMGDVRHGGQWMDFASSQRARGLVEVDGAWMTPGEREAQARREAAEASERRQAAIAASQRQEADARVREAEARARMAEAEAARAEADASVDGGIPIGYGVVGVGGPVIVNPDVQPCCGLRHAPGYCPNTPGRPRNGGGHVHDEPVVRPTPRPPQADQRRSPVVKSNQRGTGGTKN